MKPHPNMTDTERKAYIEYVLSHDLTPEESADYHEYLSDSEDRYGCLSSSIPLEELEGKTDDEIGEMMFNKKEARIKQYAEKEARIKQ